jgi:hypothetical protein
VVAVRKDRPSVPIEPAKMNPEPIFQNGSTMINFGRKREINTSGTI